MVVDISSDKDRAFMVEQVRMRVKMLGVIHLALVAGVAFFGAFALFYVRKSLEFGLSFQNPLVTASALLSIGTIVASYQLKKPSAAVPRIPSDVHEILNRYQVFFLARASILEAGALFAGVIAMVTSNVVPVVFLLVSASALVARRPTQHELVSLSCLGGK